MTNLKFAPHDLNHKYFSIQRVFEMQLNGENPFDDAFPCEIAKDNSFGEWLIFDRDAKEGNYSVTLFTDGGGAGDVSWWTLTAYSEMITDTSSQINLARQALALCATFHS